MNGKGEKGMSKSLSFRMAHLVSGVCGDCLKREKGHSVVVCLW